MSLSPGQKIGAYEVLSPLGAGGMGEVYRARDARLKRDVAIKVLPADVANDRERLARFQREAEVLASLNHPQIAHVYGIEENALVMELVDGDDLSQRLARGAIPIQEALPIARQIAEAVEAAHDAGIIHRDLKPANIKVRADGATKVLDFGLAKALDQASGIGDQGSASLANSPTITSPAMTMRGVILGTAAYMSPEQARGKAVDKRADIWAFGCVLYEMLTGIRAFKGDDVTDIITSVIRDTPDWKALPLETPLAIRTLLRRCLEKDPRKRAPHMAIARLEIDDAMMTTGEWVGGPATGPLPRRRAWPLALAFGAAMAIAASAATYFIARPAATIDATQVLRYSIDLPVAGFSGVALSPNGRFVAVSGRSPDGLPGVWVRALDGTEFTRVAETELGNAPFWSPDSTELGFFANRKLMRLRLPGGAAQEVADLSAMGTSLSNLSGSWGADGSILVNGSDGVYRVMSGGGAITRVIGDPSGARPADGLSAFQSPQWAAGQAGLFYTKSTVGVRDGGALMFRSPSGTESALTATRSRAIHTKQGLLVARSTGATSATLSVHDFDSATGTIDMPGMVLAPDATLDFAASESGVLIYRQNEGATPYRFDWLDSSGQSTGEGFDVFEPGSFNLSLDGTLLAYVEGGALMIRDMARGVATRLADRAQEPILSPDGQRIAYSLPVDAAPRIVVQSSSGGTPQTLFTNPSPTRTEDWSSDGKYLAAHLPGRGLVIPVDSTQSPTTYVEVPKGAAIDESRFSPDGRWMLFNASDSGRHEVYVVPLPPTGERWQLSPSGGSQGRWRHDGRAIYYMGANGDLMTLDITLTAGQRPKIGAPRKLFATGLTPSPNLDQFAPNADGTRFLLRRPRNIVTRDELKVIVNWPALIPRQK